MNRDRLKRLAWSIPLLALAIGGPARAQVAAPKAETSAPPSATPQAASPSPALEKALAENPVTAPYKIRLESRKGKVVMKGRVGTTAIHNAAVRTAIDLGIPVVDELVTDTAEVYRAGASTPFYGPMFSTSPLNAYSYLYPEPLFGRIDEPFAGMEPPVISYPPEWAAINARRPLKPGGEIELTAPPLPPNTVEMTIDPRGTAVLRGNVPTAADKIRVGAELAQTPGVTNVVNLLNTGEAPAPPRQRQLDDNPPPPPTPEPPSDARPRPAPPAGQAIAPDVAPAGSLDARIGKALARVPELRGVNLRVKASEGGIASLSGKVAGIREAMLAFRAVQSTPGVTAVVDSLQFPSPDASKRNPLTYDVEPEDVEPYLTAQLARHLGEVAHVDRLNVSGDRLEIRATLDRDDDRNRAEAILRSLPLLRGFKVETTFKVRP